VPSLLAIGPLASIICSSFPSIFPLICAPHAPSRPDSNVWEMRTHPTELVKTARNFVAF
jgi:hypothetical protein